MIPFAIVGSERNVIIDGKSVRGRKNRWGVVNVEDEKHCEFVYLRNFLTRFVRRLPLCRLHTILINVSFRAGHTCRTSSRPLPRSTTRRSVQNNCWPSRSRPTLVRLPTSHKLLRSYVPHPLRNAKSRRPAYSTCSMIPTPLDFYCAWIWILDMDTRHFTACPRPTPLLVAP